MIDKILQDDKLEENRGFSDKMRNNRLKFSNCGKFISSGRGRHPVRVIDSYELIYVISGHLSIYETAQNKCVYNVERGQYLLLYPGLLHGPGGEYPADLKFFYVHFYGDMRDFEGIKYGSPARPEVLANYFQLMQNEQQFVADNALCGKLLEIILLEISRMAEVEKKVDLKRFAAEAKEIIEVHFSEKLSTSIIAGRLNCNPDYLGRLFRKTYGRSIVEYLNEIRLKNVAALLEKSTFTVKEIAYSVGFNDPAYFRQQFFRRYSLCPTEYRKMHTSGHVNTWRLA